MDEETKRIYDEHYYLMDTIQALGCSVLKNGVISEIRFKSIVENGLSDTEIIIEGINDERC